MSKKDKEKIKLLFVEDDKDFSSALKSRLIKRNFEVTVMPTAEEALDKIEEIEIHAIIADVKLPGMNGMEFLAKVRELYEELPVILLTGYGSLKSAKEAVKLNAADYLLKPLESIDDLLNPVYKAVNNYKLIFENKRLTNNLQKKIKKLKEKEEFNDALFKYSPIDIIVVDCNGMVIRTNKKKSKAGDRISKIGDVMFKDCDDKADIDIHAELIDCIKSRKTKEFPAQKYGDKFLSIKMSPFLDGAIITAQDITDLEKTEEALKSAYVKLRETQEDLIQIEKSNAIIQLAGGVAHEVKNPLAIIMQAGEYLKKNIHSKKKNVQDSINMIMSNIKRADSIINTLSDFVRGTELNLKLQDINPVIVRSLNLLKHRIKLGNIKIVKKIEKNLPKVLIDSAKIEQVFVNLFLNSTQAMPKGGELFLRVYAKNLENLQNRVGRRATDYFKLGEKAVVVEVEDTGIGISKENQRNIFTPFFTTKGPKGGAGLGLSVTKNIIDMHRGMIEVQSEENKGTKFIITLKVKEGG